MSPTSVVRRPRGRSLVLAACAATVLVAAGGSRAAAARVRAQRGPEIARIAWIQAPLGIQGLSGAGRDVAVPFALVDRRHARTDIQAQYGIDRDGDGAIEDGEYAPATENRRDPRNSRGNRAPRLFVTSSGSGAANAFVWDCAADLPGGRRPTQDYRRTDQGRRIPDRSAPGEFQFDPAAAGVRFRIRAVRSVGRRVVAGDWAVTQAFTVDNDTAPRMTIDEVAPRAADGAPGYRVDVVWTAFDRDSEDLDGDGRFGPDEDLDGDGRFLQEQVGVAFDFHLLEPGEDPSAMTTDELEALHWFPCTRDASDGDTDSFRAPPPADGEADARVFASPGGRTWRFVWDVHRDLGRVTVPMILRARCIDADRRESDVVHVTEPFVVGE